MGDAVDRERFSRARLNELSTKIHERLAEILGDRKLCVYATGSYGRLEAWDGSDVDLFLLHKRAGSETRIPRVLKLRILGRLIEEVYALDFPEFDQDGRFLEIHDLVDMRKALGSEQDDSVNAFTARMLLLLEGRAVYGANTYEAFLDEGLPPVRLTPNL